MRTNLTWSYLCVATILSGTARADIDDEKAWDRERYESYILRNTTGER